MSGSQDARGRASTEAADNGEEDACHGQRSDTQARRRRRSRVRQGPVAGDNGRLSLQAAVWLRRHDRRNSCLPRLRAEAMSTGREAFACAGRALERPWYGAFRHASGLAPRLKRGARDASNAWICREALCPVDAAALEVRDGNLAGNLNSLEW